MPAPVPPPRLSVGVVLLALGSLVPPSTGTGCAGSSTPAPTRGTPVAKSVAAGDARTPAPPEPATTEPPASAYDLAADREARVAAAKKGLGEKAPAAVVSDVFVLVGASDWRGAAFTQSVSLVDNAMKAFLNGRFAKKPDRAITVYLFGKGASYESFCKQTYGAPCIAHYGFYEPGNRFMVMNAGLGLGTLTHELVHPLVEADFPRAPTWLNEGIASVFEGPVIPKPGEIHGVKNWRHPRVLRALTTHEKAMPTLDGLFAMSDTTFRGDDEDLHYAMARYVCLWLDARNQLWPFYQRWRDDVTNDPTGEKAFAAVTGETPARANAAWVKWVRAL